MLKRVQLEIIIQLSENDTGRVRDLGLDRLGKKAVNKKNTGDEGDPVKRMGRMTC